MYFNILLGLFLTCEFSLLYCEANVNDYILKRIGVGKCRAACISEFYLPNGQFRDESNLECTPTTNWKCGMCWDYCDMLIEEEQTRNQMCNDNICLDGCKLACKFYKNNQTSEQLPRGSFAIFNIKLSSALLSWNYKTEANSNLKTIFVAFGLKSNGKWEEVDQVSEEKISLKNEDQKLFSTAIFAVTSRGILAYAMQNLTRDVFPLHEKINFSVLDKLAKNEAIDLKGQEIPSLYLEQWAICLIVCSVFVFLIIIFNSLYFHFLNNKLFYNLRNKQSLVPSSMSNSLSANSAFYIDMDQTITHTTRL